MDSMDLYLFWLKSNLAVLAFFHGKIVNSVTPKQVDRFKIGLQKDCAPRVGAISQFQTFRGLTGITVKAKYHHISLLCRSFSHQILRIYSKKKNRIRVLDLLVQYG